MLKIRNKNLFTQASTLITKFTRNSSGAYEEVRIPVPWGYIAGKWWGPQDKRPILGIHGTQDNCGSFDRLAPYLQSHIGFLAIDLPGHGLSSHAPPGVYHHTLDSVIVIRRIVQYFNWPKVSLLGHSLGGILGYLYAVFFRNTVDFLICLDGIMPPEFVTQDVDFMPHGIDALIKYDNLNMDKDRPCYSLFELNQKLHEANEQSIALENCKYILRRNVAPSEVEPNKFYLNRDQRLKILYLQNWPKFFTPESARRLSCPTFMSYSSKRIQSIEKLISPLQLTDILQKTHKHFKFHKVEGTHHAHLNNPERLEGLINQFIKEHDKEDRSVGGIKHEIKVNEMNAKQI